MAPITKILGKIAMFKCSKYDREGSFSIKVWLLYWQHSKTFVVIVSYLMNKLMRKDLLGNKESIQNSCISFAVKVSLETW